MIDLNLLKADPKIVAKQLNSKNYALNVSSFETLEAERKKFQTQTEDLQAQRNALSKEYGMLKKEGKEDSILSQKIDSIKTELDLCSNKLSDIQLNIKDFLLDIPNLPDPTTPTGSREEYNVVVRRICEPEVSGGKDHLEITSMINTESALSLIHI